MTPLRRSPLLYSLQIGRAIAALGVVLHHSAVALEAGWPGYSKPFLNTIFLGYLGVEYFFVLSGFIIAHIAQSMPPSSFEARRYATSRALRIYMPYLPVGALMVAGFLLIPHLSQTAGSSFSYVGSLLLPSNAPPALSVAWTLQHEIVFYALFGLSYFVFGNIRYLFLWVIPIMLGLLFALPQWARILVAPINLEFLLGVSAYYAYKSGLFYRLRYVLIAIGLAVVFLSGFLLYDRVVSSYRFIAAIGFCGIVLGLALIERTFEFRKLALPVYIGAASYSLYLTHGPVISILARTPLTHAHWVAALMGLVGASLLVGAAYYAWFERPMLNYFKRRL